MQTVDQAIEQLKEAINLEVKVQMVERVNAAIRADEQPVKRVSRKPASKANGKPASKANDQATKGSPRSAAAAERLGAITTFIKGHSGCKATEIAESLGLDVKKVSTDLGKLRAQMVVESKGKTRNTTWSTV